MRREEIDQPQHVGVVAGADNHRPRAGFDQSDPPQDQGAHDPLAQLGLGDKQRPKPLRRHHHRLDIGQGIGVDQRRPPRKLRQLAHERAALMGNDVGPPARLVMLANLDLAVEDKDEAQAWLADGCQRLRPGGTA